MTTKIDWRPMRWIPILFTITLIVVSALLYSYHRMQSPSTERQVPGATSDLVALTFTAPTEIGQTLPWAMVIALAVTGIAVLIKKWTSRKPDQSIKDQEIP